MVVNDTKSWNLTKLLQAVVSNIKKGWMPMNFIDPVLCTKRGQGPDHVLARLSRTIATLAIPPAT